MIDCCEGESGLLLAFPGLHGFLLLVGLGGGGQEKGYWQIGISAIGRWGPLEHLFPVTSHASIGLLVRLQSNG